MESSWLYKHCSSSFRSSLTRDYRLGSSPAGCRPGRDALPFQEPATVADLHHIKPPPNAVADRMVQTACASCYRTGKRAADARRCRQSRAQYNSRVLRLGAMSAMWFRPRLARVTALGRRGTAASRTCLAAAPQPPEAAVRADTDHAQSDRCNMLWPALRAG
jgi:hypothetical protein